jgi:serine/threonine-protein kinase
VVAVRSSLEERAARRVGTVLRGKYRIVGVLGIGGMASVYSAVHRNGSRVAIKVLHEEVSIRADARARFLREGYAANRIGHPGAVQILDDDTADDGAAFLVMELLRGETLRARAERAGGKLPWREVLALGRQLLDVLVAAHARGVVHRDIKPDNLFLTTSRALKVLDFGIARVEDDLGAHATATGTRLGTPAYMPPEVALGRTAEIDARSDVWSAGATLFMLLSGRAVHDGESSAEVAVRAATMPAPPLGSVIEGVPPEVAAIVDRALRFRREDRWPSARAMLDAIDAAAGGELEVDAIGAVPAQDDALRADETEAPRDGATTASVEITAAPRSREAEIPTASSEPATDGPVEGPRLVPAPARRPLRAKALALLGVAVIAAGVVVSGLRASRVRAGDPAATSAARAPAPPCASSAECVARLGGAPALCRKDDGACVALANDACEVLAEPADVGNDATVWIGALWPHKRADPEHYGRRSANAIELARRDFAEASGGLPPARPGGPRRPIAIVLCDDRDDPERAAAHLVDDLRVPAILGFGTSKEVLDLAPSLFIPRGVLAVVATGSATTIRDLPRRPGEPRLVVRASLATDAYSWPFAALVERVIEPELRASLPPGEPVRVALLRHDSFVGHITAGSRIRELRFNGKSVADNGDAFLQIARPNYLVGGDFTAENERIARAIAAFRPHVVLDMPPNPGLVAAVERAWPASAAIRPRYLLEDTWSDLREGVLDWRRDGLAARMYPVDLVSTPATLRFALRYNEVFTPRVTPATAPTTPYDAFYLVAYAAAALGDQPITGRALAGALERLLPPGEPIEVGSAGIHPAFLALAAGRKIDLQGAATPLDLDLETGETSGAFALYCLVPPRGAGAARLVESGMVFDAGRREMRGVRRCP